MHKLARLGLSRRLQVQIARRPLIHPRSAVFPPRFYSSDSDLPAPDAKLTTPTPVEPEVTSESKDDLVIDGVAEKDTPPHIVKQVSAKMPSEEPVVEDVPMSSMEGLKEWEQDTEMAPETIAVPLAETSTRSRTEKPVFSLVYDPATGTRSPNLMVPDPLLDTFDSSTFTPPKTTIRNKVVVRNEPSMFIKPTDKRDEYVPYDYGYEGWDHESADPTIERESPMDHVSMAKWDIDRLHRYSLVTRIVKKQTGKGKIMRYYHLIVIGNGNGLVGYGEGKDAEGPRASQKALAQAIRSMDTVERFEQRTVWTEMETKLGGTRVILRPRPVGFGLHCNPNIHQVLKAAGIKDASAKVWGSRNPINVIKATFRMLQAGNAPLAMGDGIGGKGKKLEKGTGVRGKSDVERERGRRLLDLRTW
ncbi:hypothetical protein JAAARDRAFT_34340 [Jaapia argillacea MUCL 33604]|uniref:Small ribosomal subunit protein uS5m n=1 Tax=Jaapia argillacea MUCL 33604 TaxID=933084 RepID=A0A067Q7E7_9AGAM|nr:hypothetical protein JAAARDRAFT_34340 [Jaapia argillacea MUCL 33604]